MSKLTYDDFTRTGYQDCGNTFDVSDHYDAWRRLGKPRSGASVARKVVLAAWGDDTDMYEEWLRQNDVSEMIQDDLDPRSAYKMWRNAWQECAESAVKNRLKHDLEVSAFIERCREVAQWADSIKRSP